MAPPLAPHNAAQKLDRLQAELISTARMWAVDEVGAAMAHQLAEPLTALLLYLHQIKDTPSQTGEAISEIVEKALHETERACEIMERMGHVFEPSPSPDTALARGRAAIDWLTQNSTRTGQPSAPLHVRQDILTPREREVLSLITEGVSNKEGGYRLGISMRTFEVHRAHIMGKLGAKNAADLVRMALSEPRFTESR
jgi:DNA-binding NarL/FixJ family response regulator